MQKNNKDISLVEALFSNQEEADTKLLLHAKHMLDSDARKLVLVRSPSGAVDIQDLFISTYQENPSRSESTLILAMVDPSSRFS